MTNGTEREPECCSLSGKPLYPVEYPQETDARYRSNLAAAEARYRQAPDDEDAIVWYGRRLGYLTRYRKAIEVYTEGISGHPESFVLLRHRGHRYLSIREFGKAVDDLEKARALCLNVPDSMEIDGEPNKAGVPTSTVRFNILYHLALARYLLGQFEDALAIYRECMDYSRINDDSLVATSDWLYMTLMRLGKKAEAA